MKQKAVQLADYAADRLGQSLRAVGYHTNDEFEVVHIREELLEQYPADVVEQFIQGSRDVHADLQHLDEVMGAPEASLHLLNDGLILQFHYPGADVIFLSMDKEIGRNFTGFIDDCFAHMD